MYGRLYEDCWDERLADAPITDGQILAFREALKVLPVYATYHPEVNLYQHGSLTAMKSCALPG